MELELTKDRDKLRLLATAALETVKRMPLAVGVIADVLFRDSGDPAAPEVRLVQWAATDTRGYPINKIDEAFVIGDGADGWIVAGVAARNKPKRHGRRKKA